MIRQAKLTAAQIPDACPLCRTPIQLNACGSSVVFDRVLAAAYEALDFGEEMHDLIKHVQRKERRIAPGQSQSHRWAQEVSGLLEAAEAREEVLQKQLKRLRDCGPIPDPEHIDAIMDLAEREVELLKRDNGLRAENAKLSHEVETLKQLLADANNEGSVAKRRKIT